MRSLSDVEINSVSGGNPTGGFPDVATGTALSAQQNAAAVQQAASQAAAQQFAPLALQAVSILLPETKALNLVKATLDTIAHIMEATSPDEGGGDGGGDGGGGGVTKDDAPNPHGSSDD